MFPDLLLVGSGNVGAHLARVFHSAGVNIAISSRNETTGQALAEELGIPFFSPGNVPVSDRLAIIATQDGQISNAAAMLAGKVRGIVHTSGTVPGAVLQKFSPVYGVFYPLQTIRKEALTVWDKVPMCIDASTAELMTELESLAGAISARTYQVNDEQRKHLHVAAVLVNNFTNHLAARAKSYVEQHGLDFSILYPLVEKTMSNIISGADPAELQTGPAHRGDTATMQEHLHLIMESGDDTLAELYAVLSRSIMR